MLHTKTPYSNFAATAILPIPNNIDASESNRSSLRDRVRDFTANVMSSQQGQSDRFRLSIDITTDNTLNAVQNQSVNNQINHCLDPHIQSYDCFGAVSLTSAMQSNVPQPFSGGEQFSHLNMPGGQDLMRDKFTSQDLHSSHYRELRNNIRLDWNSYNQDATIDKRECFKMITTTKFVPRVVMFHPSPIKYSFHNVNVRTFCQKVANKAENSKQNDAKNMKLPKKEQLKRAFKEYGATIVVFHVTLSLISLGSFYAIVSSGIDLMPIMEYFQLTSSALSKKIATGASTFVVAYAIHKVFAPIRISLTLGLTPFIVRYFRSKGYLKPKITKPN